MIELSFEETKRAVDEYARVSLEIGLSGLLACEQRYLCFPAPSTQTKPASRQGPTFWADTNSPFPTEVLFPSPRNPSRVSWHVHQRPAVVKTRLLIGHCTPWAQFTLHMLTRNCLSASEIYQFPKASCTSTKEHWRCRLQLYLRQCVQTPTGDTSFAGNDNDMNNYRDNVTLGFKKKKKLSAQKKYKMHER